MVSKLHHDFIWQQAAKLFSSAGIKKIARDPFFAYNEARRILLDRKYRDAMIAEQLSVYADSISALERLSQTISPTVGTSSSSLESWLGIEGDDPHAASLGELFRRHGSDKSSMHDYHRIYGAILGGKRSSFLNILEIGLGTNNLDVPSNMGLSGKPGASLRAFRDWAVNAEIYGADVDERILFTEDRISTFWVDQTSEISLSKLAAQLHGKRFDLIIDDGLHFPHANFNTIKSLLPLLSPTGVMVIEDIRAVDRPFWRIAGILLSFRYEVCLARTKSADIFAIRNRTAFS